MSRGIVVAAMAMASFMGNFMDDFAYRLPTKDELAGRHSKYCRLLRRRLRAARKKARK